MKRIKTEYTGGLTRVRLTIFCCGAVLLFVQKYFNVKSGTDQFLGVFMGIAIKNAKQDIK